MKVKMLETYQGVGHTATLLHEWITVSVLENGESYEVDLTLGAWLVDNRKATEITEPVHYGAQKEPEYPRNDELKYEAMTGSTAAGFESLPELTEENAKEEKSAEPIMTTKNTEAKPKRSRK